jgi:hypothetical protein
MNECQLRGGLVRRTRGPQSQKRVHRKEHVQPKRSWQVANIDRGAFWTLEDSSVSMSYSAGPRCHMCGNGDEGDVWVRSWGPNSSWEGAVDSHHGLGCAGSKQNEMKEAKETQPK